MLKGKDTNYPIFAVHSSLLVAYQYAFKPPVNVFSISLFGLSKPNITSKRELQIVLPHFKADKYAGLPDLSPSQK